MTAATVTPLHAAALAYAQRRATQGRYVNPADIARDPAFQDAITAAVGAEREDPAVIAMRDAEIRVLRAQLARGNPIPERSPRPPARNPKPRGLCSVCGRNLAIRRDGAISLHSGTAAGKYGEPCRGEGKPPKEQR